ncbi:hypothetical protein SLEP1_g3402 [Rubroshorea leprosula]|uniref:Uncharacterized protein n=1 Tax=Rubroshorea leprosula TaxID=152421 RepID=A0AAV5HU15_9ROSI|nr:hypothetical protein SLEP1_g3402 [Rubroshorea leprosula]
MFLNPARWLTRFGQRVWFNRLNRGAKSVWSGEGEEDGWRSCRDLSKIRDDLLCFVASVWSGEGEEDPMKERKMSGGAVEI